MWIRAAAVLAFAAFAGFLVILAVWVGSATLGAVVAIALVACAYDFSRELGRHPGETGDDRARF